MKPIRMIEHKLAELTIKKYKLFQNFKLDLTDDKGNPLDTVILAGINGSGKTTILDFISETLSSEDKKDKSNIVRVKLIGNLSEMKKLGDRINSSELNPFPVQKKEISNYIDHFILDNNKFSNVTVREAREAAFDEINKLFNILDINIQLIDRKDGKPIFINFQGKKLGLEDLSAGEQELFIRVLRLKILSPNKKIVLIDEPEFALHPSWQQKILKVYKKILSDGDNQVILATHSPQVIASADVKSVFLLKPNLETKQIDVSMPKYTKGHTINYVLSEIMGADYRDTKINNDIEEYLALIRNGEHETIKGMELKNIIDNLDPNSEDRIRIDFALRRFKVLKK
jgi:predicted ATP-binding protein involved in virulence